MRRIRRLTGLLVPALASLLLTGCPELLDLIGGGGESPTLTVTGLAPGATITVDTLEIQGIASDTDGDMQSVTAYIQEQPTITATAFQFLQNGAWTIALSLGTLQDGAYTLVVTAEDQDGNKSQPFTVSFTLSLAGGGGGGGGSAPATPTGLVVTGPTSSTLTVSWNASTGATSYQAYRDTNPGGAFTSEVFTGAGTSFTDTGLSPNTRYYYKVRATNSSGSSAKSASNYGNTTPGGGGGTPPATPGDLVVDGATTSTLDVSWSASAGATTYQAYRDTNPTGSFSNLVFSGAAQSFTDGGLLSNTTYYYRVKATNAGGSSALSAAVSGSTTGSAPATPTGLAVTGATASSLNVSWNFSAGATTYQVYRDTSTVGGFSTQVFSGGINSFTDTGLASSTTYFYKVRALNANGPSALSTFAAGTTSAGGGGGSPPATPTGLTVGDATPGTLDVSWTAEPTATGYQVFRDTSPGGTFSTVVHNNASTSFTDYGLDPGTTYYYKVRALNANGPSPLSAAVGGTTTSAGGGGDVYEPDDYYGAALQIGVGDTAQQRTLHAVGDLDWLWFLVEPGETYVIETHYVDMDTDTVLELYEMDGTALLTSDDDGGATGGFSRIQWTAPIDGGWYAFIRVTGYLEAATGSYAIDVVTPEGTVGIIVM